MSTAVGGLIRRARDRHVNFSVANHTNRVALAFLSTRQQELLKQLAADLKDRLSEARQIADTIATSLVGVDGAGTPYAIMTSGDAVGFIVGADGVPYLDDTVIALDPYADGFPLPADSLHLIDVYATMTTGAVRPVHIIPQGDWPDRSGVSDLFAFVNGWRLMALRNPVPSTSVQDVTPWTAVESVTMVWVDTPARFSEGAGWEDQTLTLPDLYADVLEYDLTAYLATIEYARDKETFPADLVSLYTKQAAEALGKALSGAKNDNRGLRVHRTRLNR